MRQLVGIDAGDIKMTVRKCVLALTLSLSGVACAANHEILSIKPNAALSSPGSKLEIFGRGFAEGCGTFFGGVAARLNRVINSSKVEVVTPYLRPGSYEVQVLCKDQKGRRGATFKSLPSSVDLELRNASTANSTKALEILGKVARSNSDPQVRAYARFLESKIHFARQEWQDWAASIAGIFVEANEAGLSIQTYWPYRLEYART